MADEAKIEAADETPAKPEYLLDKFQTEADQARAYADLEKETGRLRSELGQERQQFTEALARIEAQQTAKPTTEYNPRTDPLVAQYGQAIEAGDYASAMMIQAAVNAQAAEQAIDRKLNDLKPALSAQEESQREVAFTMAQNRLASEYGDRWEALKPQVFQMLNDRPHWLPQTATVDGYASVLKEAAQVVDSARIVREQEAADRDRATKLSAQGITGNTSRAPLTGDAAAAAEKMWAEVQNAKTGGYTSLIRD